MTIYAPIDTQYLPTIYSKTTFMCLWFQHSHTTYAIGKMSSFASRTAYSWPPNLCFQKQASTQIMGLHPSKNCRLQAASDTCILWKNFYPFVHKFSYQDSILVLHWHIPLCVYTAHHISQTELLMPFSLLGGSSTKLAQYYNPF
jgi:hypothetical protein